MAVTKILAKRARLDVMVSYALNGDKTEEGILTAYWNCHEHNPYLQMKLTKQETGKTDGVQGYHIIQSFAKGEIQPEQALEIAKEYVRECLPGYQAVIGTHVDKEHIHKRDEKYFEDDVAWQIQRAREMGIPLDHIQLNERGDLLDPRTGEPVVFGNGG